MTLRRSIPAATVLLAAVVAAACGVAGGTPNSTETTASPSAVPSATTSAAPTASAAPSSPAPSADTTDVPPTGLTLEPLVDGLDSPLDIATRPGDDSTMLVAEQVGRLRVVRDGALVETPFLDIRESVTAGGEQGLLGVAVHPDPADGRVFVYYTDEDERQVVASYRTDPGDPDRALADSEQRVLVMDDRFGNHNGGGLQFGPDGFLYISTGDGGGAGDPLDSGRDLGSLLAKILRIDVDVAADSDPPYGIPADNPFVDEDDARGEVWLTGLRNPFRFRIDPTSGDLWIGDVGQGAVEEIDLAPAGVGGLDFGWNLMEGSRCFETDPCDDSGLTLPVAEYGHDDGCSVTGGAVYRGTAQPGLAGWYVFADYCSGRMWLLDAEAVKAGGGTQVEAFRAFDSDRSISAIAPGSDGELYVTDLGAGEVLRVVATTD